VVKTGKITVLWCFFKIQKDENPSFCHALVCETTKIIVVRNIFDF